MLSNSEAKEPESEAAECDSSSTVGGRSECDEALGAKSSADIGLEATDETLELILLGKGGFVTRLLLPLVCNRLSDTDVVMLGASEMLMVDGEVVVATAAAAIDPMFDAAS